MNLLGAYCPKEGELRYRSIRPFRPEEKLENPRDFEPLGDSPAPTMDTLQACFSCGDKLMFRRIAETRPNAPSAVAASGGAMQTLFSLDQGEEVKAVREVPTDRFVIITSKRVVMFDLNALVVEASHAEL